MTGPIKPQINLLYAHYGKYHSLEPNGIEFHFTHENIPSREKKNLKHHPVFVANTNIAVAIQQYLEDATPSVLGKHFIEPPHRGKGDSFLTFSLLYADKTICAFAFYLQEESTEPQTNSASVELLLLDKFYIPTAQFLPTEHLNDRLFEYALTFLRFGTSFHDTQKALNRCYNGKSTASSLIVDSSCEAAYIQYFQEQNLS